MEGFAFRGQAGEGCKAGGLLTACTYVASTQRVMCPIIATSAALQISILSCSCHPACPRPTCRRQGLDYAFPSASVVGGLSSSGSQGRQRALFAWSATDAAATDADGEGAPTSSSNSSGGGSGSSSDSSVLNTGAVVLALSGPVVMELLIAQVAGVHGLHVRSACCTLLASLVANSLIYAPHPHTPTPPPPSAPPRRRQSTTHACKCMQGCRPLNERVYTIDAVGPRPNLVAGVKDDRGKALTPVEALQRDLMEQASSKSDL